ncbi:class A beta-lactamase [Cohaesibacter haloalkalitolerans]|uniref:class A beta-lactamase n=1 Tax=Cohaesibacter haloalkalitolerans TaxID=1162980 RepID=UPI000E650250|nr:class A beta-lactamase [Cohaesibacter haloalkalitolerans]
MKKTRLSSLNGALLAVALCITASGGAIAQDLKQTITSWETRLGARIGVTLRATPSDSLFAYKADQRFPMASTFKSLMCGAVLARVDAGSVSLSDRVTYQADQLQSYSPITKDHVESGMDVADLCEAAITLSDNTAANLMLEKVDGPAGLTTFLRTIGDETTRLDRWEPDLNEGIDGDPRDTTTPDAMTLSLSRLLFGETLQPASAGQLRQWMIDDKVAGALIRPHLPEGWIIGDKTGTGGNGTRGIVAFLKKPDGEAYVTAIYVTATDADITLRNEAISDIGRAVIDEIRAH